MAAANPPIVIREALTLTSLGIAPQFVNYTHVTMESDRYICVRETSPQNSVVIIDMAMPSQPLRRPITADSALMNPNTRIVAVKAQIPGTTQEHLQIFNIEAKTKVKSHQMPEQVVFWKWITPKLLGLVTQTSVYHWSIEGDSEPAKMFNRTANLANNQIINYRCDPAEKWLVLIGIAPGAPVRAHLVKGNMQLFSVGQQRSQALEAHAASFATIKVPGNENPSTLICFASKATYAGQIISKLHVVEIGAQPGKPGFSKKQADLFFPPDFEDDFPVTTQISQKYGLVYVITKLGLLFVYDLETASVYRNRISPDPIFLTAESSTTGGFYAINRRGQVLHATVNDATVVPSVSGQMTLKNQLPLPRAASTGPLQELHRITDGFSEKRLLGKGGFGTVYKGIFDNGEVIAVKKLHNMPGLVEGLFKNELLNLMTVKHQNIIRLVGYCSEAKQIVGEHEGKKHLFYREERALCLEYLQGGNLEELLSDESSKIDWEECYKIIKGICQGINHLHTGSKDPIYHLDLKPANILLDRNRIPKIGDFGLSRLLPSTETFVTKTYSGTTGYMPPEYMHRRQISSKFDVFSLGVILIEIIAGREGYYNYKCVMSPQEFINHVTENWSQRVQSKTTLTKKLQEIHRCIKIALRCVEDNQVNRPTITEIVEELNMTL